MINIYTESGIKGPKKRDGFSLYILETTVTAKKIIKTGDGAGQMVTKDEPLTLTKGLKILNQSGDQSQLVTLLDAMKRIQKPGDVTIYISSGWLYVAITEWIDKWRLTDWRTTKGDEVAFREQWQELDRLLKLNSVTYEVGTKHLYKDWMLEELDKREKEKKYVREVWRNELIY